MPLACLSQCVLSVVFPSRGPVSVEKWQAEWLRLVRDGSISSTATFADREVRYGLCLETEASTMPEEFCVGVADGTSLQLRARSGVVDGFPITLRANRALRPPAAPKLGALPPHGSSPCFRCALAAAAWPARPMVAQAELETGRCWDVHFNISPMDPLGHFLLVPEQRLAANRRQQRLTRASSLSNPPPLGPAARLVSGLASLTQRSMYRRLPPQVTTASTSSCSGRLRAARARRP